MKRSTLVWETTKPHGNFGVDFSPTKKQKLWKTTSRQHTVYGREKSYLVSSEE